jgi:hypothetical protein
MTDATPTPSAAQPVAACPFCNSKNASPFSVKSCHSVLCTACGGEGPESESEDGAIAAWNRRAAPPADTAMTAPPAPQPVQPWQPSFDAISHEQEQLAIQFSMEIAGPRGKQPSLPDPVRLLEMAEALYLAEWRAFFPGHSAGNEVSKTDEKESDMIALLQDKNFRMSGGSEFALEIVAKLRERLGEV